MARRRNKNEEPAVVTVDELEGIVGDEEVEEAEEETPKPITPADIADATGADPKAIRGWLRANHPRPKGMKGKSWNIKPEVAQAVIEHFTASDDEDVEDEELVTEESD